VNSQSTQPHRSGTVAIVGRPNVGKSTLLNAAIGQPLAIVSKVPQTTRNRILGVVVRGAAEIILLDTPGIHKPKSSLGRSLNRTARETARDADVLVYVATPGPGVHPGDSTLLADIGTDQQNVVLVVNKVDLVKNKGALLPFLVAMTELRPFAAVVPISALTGDGVDRVLDEVALLLPAGEPRFEPDTVTDQPVRFFAAELIREQVLAIAREEVPHAIAVRIDSFEEADDAVRIHATIDVERDGQKAIVIGRGGSMLKTIGTAARGRIAELVGRTVHLKLFVRVTPGWTDSAQALAELGYGGTK
jgi:GTP-binding protein Era